MPATDLLSKYRRLCGKHGALVGKLENYRRMRLSLLVFARWVTVGRAPAAAVLHGKEILLTNRAWAELQGGRGTRGRWQELTEEGEIVAGGPEFPSLREAARALVARLCKASSGAIDGRPRPPVQARALKGLPARSARSEARSAARSAAMSAARSAAMSAARNAAAAGGPAKSASGQAARESAASSPADAGTAVGELGAALVRRAFPAGSAPPALTTRFRQVGKARVVELCAELLDVSARPSGDEMVVTARDVTAADESRAQARREREAAAASDARVLQQRHIVHDLRNVLMALMLRARPLSFGAHCRELHGRENEVIERLLKHVSEGLDRLQETWAPSSTSALVSASALASASASSSARERAAVAAAGAAAPSRPARAGAGSGAAVRDSLADEAAGAELMGARRRPAVRAGDGRARDRQTQGRPAI